MERLYKIETIERGEVILEISSDYISNKIDSLLDNYDYVELGFKSGYATRITLVSEKENENE